MTINSKVNIIVLIGLLLFLLVMSALSISSVEYNGESAPIYIFASITELLRPAKTDLAFLLRDFTAKTPYGNIYIKRFTRVAIQTYGGKYTFDILSNNPTQITNDLIILENKIAPNTAFRFGSWSNEETHWQNPDLLSAVIPKIADEEPGQDIRIGKYTFRTGTIRITKTSVKEMFELNLVNRPETLYLTDGTEISHLTKDGEKTKRALLTISDNGIWEYDGFMYIKRSGQEEKRYEYIRFRENWGNFIDGREFVRRSW